MTMKRRDRRVYLALVVDTAKLAARIRWQVGWRPPPGVAWRLREAYKAIQSDDLLRLRIARQNLGEAKRLADGGLL